METSFVIGLGTRDKVHKCINDITPYDMTSSVMCALSGSFVLLGGWCVVMWGECHTSDSCPPSIRRNLARNSIHYTVESLTPYEISPISEYEMEEMPRLTIRN